MLRAEPNVCYEVYPSWADYKVSWQELKPHVSDPLRSSLLYEEDHAWFAKMGIVPRSPELIEVWDGPAGGGLIIEEARSKPNLTWYVLNKVTDVTSPMGASDARQGAEHVVYLEPLAVAYDPFRERRPRVYDQCTITYEHAEAAGDCIYWLIDFVKGTKEIDGLDDIPRLAQGFGLAADRLREVPPALAVETADWFWEEGHSLAWFAVRGGRDGIGFQYAVVVYIALYLCKEAGRRLKRMHLIADLETKARFRAIVAQRSREWRRLKAMKESRAKVKRRPE